MQKDMSNHKKNRKNHKKNNKGMLGWILFTLAVLWLANIFTTSNVAGVYGAPREMIYGEFYQIL
ncbi:MAG: hypothetical protein PHY56_02075, partial [Candidatus Omnitrophica bacterium]|nr:hypothetical protein [Candidatus Omnitrophota bacterium]